MVMKNIANLFKIFLIVNIFTFSIHSNAEINNECKNKEVKAFVKGSCLYCHKLIKLLKKYEFKYDVTELSTKAVVASWLINTTKSNTVPYVYLDGKYIGGYTDFVRICRLKDESL